MVSKFAQLCFQITLLVGKEVQFVDRCSADNQPLLYGPSLVQAYCWTTLECGMVYRPKYRWYWCIAIAYLPDLVITISVQ